MKNSIKAVVFIALLSLMMAVGSCSASSNMSDIQPINVKVVITRDFGDEVLLERDIEVKNGSNAIHSLCQIAQVETSYGGGFVESINGISSQYAGVGSTQQDWFLFVNGLMSNTGAIDYSLKDGDVEVWDFHTWKYHRFIPAITGYFPYPFISGFEGQNFSTIIGYSSQFETNALRLESALRDKGVTNISIKDIHLISLSEKENSHLILIDTENSLLIGEINQEWRKLGLFAYTENKELVTFTEDGRIGKKYGEGTGLIQATQSPWNPEGTGSAENVVWIITGTDEKGVQAALNTIIEKPNELRYSFSAVITEGEIIKLPQ